MSPEEVSQFAIRLDFHQLSSGERIPLWRNQSGGQGCKSGGEANPELLAEEKRWLHRGHNSTPGTPGHPEDIHTVNGGEGMGIFFSIPLV